MPKTYYAFLTVHLSGKMRLTVRSPRLLASEVAYRVKVVVPDSQYGKIVGDVVLPSLPEQPKPILDIGPDPYAIGSVTRQAKNGSSA